MQTVEVDALGDGRSTAGHSALSESSNGSEPEHGFDNTGGIELRWASFVGARAGGQLGRRKRLLDLIVGFALVLFTLPLVVVLAVGSALCFREWPFFAHSRVGQSGSIFRFLKIRSMPSSTPRYADKYSLRALDVGRWAGFLRRTHLDELPQLWLVLTGKMSLVGPRPEMPELLMSFNRDFVEERLTVPQGCTGLWQVSSGAAGLIGEGPEWDLFYIANWSLRLDCWILWRTLLAAVGRPVQSLESVPSWCLASTRDIQSTPAVS